MTECATWREALELGDSEHIALVGGGGKNNDVVVAGARTRDGHELVAGPA